MKYTLLLLINLICWNSYSQNPDVLDYKKWAIGVNFTSSLSNRWISSSPLEEEINNEISEKETFNFGYRVGGSFQYEIKSKFFLSLGIAFSDRTFRTRTTELTWAVSNPEFPTAKFTSYHHKYIDIPLKLSYTVFSKNKLSLYAGAGITSSVFMEKSQITNVQTNGTWSENEDKQNIGYDVFFLLGELDFGVNYQLANAFRLTCGLNFQQSLKAINSNLSSRSYLYSGGITLGVVYTPFNKK